MRVALPVWNGRVSPVFDTARHLLILDIDAGQTVSRSEAGSDETLWPLKVRRLSGLGVQVLICGGISPGLADMIGAYGIRVVPGVAGNAEEVIKAFVSGQIQSSRFFMPGWRACAPARRRGGRRGRFRGRRVVF